MIEQLRFRRGILHWAESSFELARRLKRQQLFVEPRLVNDLILTWDVDQILHVSHKAAILTDADYRRRHVSNWIGFPKGVFWMFSIANFLFDNI